MVTACLRAVNVDYFQNNLNIYLYYVRLSRLSRLYHTTNLQYSYKIYLQQYRSALILSMGSK